MKVALLSLVTFAAALFAQPAYAQDPDDVLEDAGDFREALGRTLYANVRIDGGSITGDYRLEARADGVTLRPAAGDAVTVALDDESLDYALRLLALSLSTGSPADGFEALGLPLAEQLITFDTLATEDGRVLIRRYGSARASIFLEPGTARPRGLQATSDEGVWRVRIDSYSERSSGWFPSRLVLTLDGGPVLIATISDVAPSGVDLAPLPQTSGGARGALAFPRLPL